MKENLW